ncbi:MAG: sugar phosphate isomerase/epimerase [Acidobacteriaceae bacterium]
MMTRRKFLKSSAAALPVMAINSTHLWAAEPIPLGVQLYTVRGMAEKDLPATLKQIRAIGYDEVELYGGGYGRPADKLRAIIHDAGLRAPSGHFAYDSLPGKLGYAQQLGLKWVVCPMLPHSLWTLDGFRAAAKQFNAVGRRAQDMGMRFAFHNHDYEFRDYGGGKSGYDVLVEETDPAHVFFELDCYWAAQAGRDPLKMLRRMGKRIRLLHLKDRKPGFPPSFDMGPSSGHFAPVGEGSIAWKPILDEAQRLAVEHYFVEQDNTYGHPIASIRASYRYLRPLLP